MQTFIPTSEKPTSDSTPEKLTSSPAGFPVSHTAAPENGWERTTLDTSGRKCLEQYARLNPGGLLARTFPALLIGQKGWFSGKCALIWRLKGTKSRFIIFRLVPLTRRTSENESGLLPTPLVSDVMGGRTTKGKKRRGETGLNGVFLPTPMSSEAEKGASGPSQMNLTKLFLPTPTANPEQRTQFQQGGKSLLCALLPTPTITGNNNRAGSSKKAGDGLTTRLKELIPTPRASEWKGVGQINSASLKAHLKQSYLAATIQEAHGKTSQLNHRFVLEMMGFPPNWCDLPFQEGKGAELLVTSKPGKGTDGKA